MGPGRPPGGEPLYARIAAELRTRIRDGTYAPGALLPSRNELAAMYSVSAITARDALAVLSHEGYARAIRGRGHVVRRRRPRLAVPGRMYAAADLGGTMLDPAVTVPHRIDVYQETPPDNIALPLQWRAGPVWVRRAVHVAAADRQPVQVHVSWLPGLNEQAGPWPRAVELITGRRITAVLQNTRARGANPFEAQAFGLPAGTVIFVTHLTAYDGQHRPAEHSRFAWPADAVRMSEEYSYPALPDPGASRS
ncbi:MAG TPA: GntR family transcriptional regulator [Streptosporangiaceae bacterium]|nr:GntR family transcriptional regulator [Streptosporangiaceae bacterium]